MPDQLLTKKGVAPPGELSPTQPEALTAMKAVHAFKTLRNPQQGKTRCYFTSLDSETKAGSANQVNVTLPIERGLVFSGAYLDLRDQAPFGEYPPE